MGFHTKKKGSGKRGFARIVPQQYLNMRAEHHGDLEVVFEVISHRTVEGARPVIYLIEIKDPSDATSSPPPSPLPETGRIPESLVSV